MTRVRAELTESRGEPHLHGAGSGKPVAGDGPVEDTALHALAARFRSLLHGGASPSSRLRSSQYGKDHLHTRRKCLRIFLPNKGVSAKIHKEFYN